MALNISKIPFFLSILLPIWVLSAVESATSPTAPSPAVDCSDLVAGMADCLSFVSNGSPMKKPQGSCCAGLKNVMKTNAECLCEAFKNSAQFGLPLNITKAMTLPSVCRISSSPISSCGVDVVPGAAPAPSPMAPSPSVTAGGPTTNSSAGVEVAPEGGNSTSSAPAVSIFFGSFVLSMFAAISICLS